MRWHPQSRPRRFLRGLRRLALALLLPFLLSAAFAQWWLLPHLNDYRDVLAGALSDYLHLSTQIEDVAAVRDGWRLALRLRGIRLNESERNALVARFSQATITLDLWRSLRNRRPVLSRVRLEGANLTLEQDADGTMHLLGDIRNTQQAHGSLEIARWLFALPRLEVVGERLALQRQGGVSVQLLHPYLQLQTIHDGQRLDFTAELPAGSGARLQLVVERQQGQSTGPKSGQGTFQFRADQLNLADWPLSPMFGAGRAAVELNGDWRDWQPFGLKGRFRLEGAALNAEPRFALLNAWLSRSPAVEVQFDWLQRENGWHLQGGVRLGDGQKQAVAAPTFDLTRTSEGWRGEVRELKAQEGLAWTAPWLSEPARRWLVPLDPRGELPEITFSAPPDLADYTATIQLRGVACQPVHGLPGFDNVAGTLAFGSNHGRLELDGHRVRVDTGGLLRAPFTLDALTGSIEWRRAGAELQLESSGLALANADLNGRFQGTVTVPDVGEPLLDIQGHYWDVRVERARHYLPVAVIPPKAVAWLDRALVGGRVTAGDVVFRGPPARFPFDRGEGLFETRFRVEGAAVDYMPGWPRLEQGRVSVVFRNRGLQVEADSGRVLDGDVEDLSARIDDLSKAVVEIRGRAKGAGASMWRTLEDSPAGQVLGEDLPNLQIEGTNTLDLELTIPLDPRPNQVRGRVGLLGNNVSLPAWNIELGRLRGEVRFTESDLNANNVQALLRGGPIRLDLNLAGRTGRRELQARLRGRLGIRALLGASAVALEPYFGGKSTWEAVLTTPAHLREQRNVPPFTLDLHSDLRGVAVRLPAPLGKVAGEARPLKIGLRPTPEGSSVDIALEYGSTVRAALELSDFLRQPRFKRGELRVNAGAANLPDGPGLVVVANLPRWSPSGWPTVGNGSDVPAKGRTISTTNSESGVAGPEWIVRSVEAQIDELVIGGRSFAGVELKANRQESETQIECESKGLAGRVTVPDQPTSQRPVNIALQRLHVGPPVDGAERAPFAGADPRRLPPLALTVADLRINEATLGQLRLTATPIADGIRLTDIELNSKPQRIDASGEWRWVGGGQVSRLAATLHSQSLEGTLAAFGYPDSGVERGETRADLAISWGAALPDFALERLDGTLKFQVGPGQLRDINPGLGRMIGMLSVRSLTRRLSFDFSDLFQAGMGFDRISGDFTFKRGQAYTDNMLIEAPAARIEIQGRTGLRTRDYDQTITVIPQFGGTLPVAGAIAGGPVVGAAVFVAERLLQKDIERATRYRYSLKGSWDDPVMEYLQDSSTPTRAKGFASDN